jgi:ELWxxDGT repeat protein
MTSPLFITVSADTNGELSAFLSPGAGQPEDFQTSGHLSTDGRFALFYTNAQNLTANDPNDNSFETYLRDLQTSTTTMVSVDTNGAPLAAAAHFFSTTLDGDGRYIPFDADVDLTGGGISGQQVYRLDDQTGAVLLVSADAADHPDNGSHPPEYTGISADGRYVAFLTGATNLGWTPSSGDNEIALKDLQTGAVKLVSAAVNGIPGDANDADTYISDDGRYVIFGSRSADLVANPPNDDGDSVQTYYRKDLVTGAISIVTPNADFINNTQTDGATIESVSNDLRYVLFELNATGNGNWRGTFIEDLTNNSVTDLTDLGQQVLLSGDGRHVVAITDAGIVEKDLNSGVVETLLDASLFTFVLPVLENISYDGHYVLYSGGAFVQTAVEPDGSILGFTYPEQFAIDTRPPTISIDPVTGDNIVDGADQLDGSGLVISGTTTDVETGNTVTVTVNGHDYTTNVLNDGSWSTTVASTEFTHLGTFQVTASVADNENTPAQATDSFLLDRFVGPVSTLVSSAPNGSEPTYPLPPNSAEAAAWGTTIGQISPDGRFVIFQSNAENITGTDPQGGFEVYVRDLSTGAVQMVTENGSPILPGASLDAISFSGGYALIHTSVDLTGSGATQTEVYRIDLSTGAAVLASADAGGNPALATGQNGLGEVSVKEDGESISSDGRYVLFSTNASNLGWTPISTPDIGDLPVLALKDLTTGTVQLVSSAASGNNIRFAISGQMTPDHRYASFFTDSMSLTPDSPADLSEELYRKDLQTGAITLVSTDATGAVMPNVSQFGDLTGAQFMSDDGNLLLFESGHDIYLKNISSGALTKVGNEADPSGDTTFGDFRLSGDGEHLAYDVNFFDDQQLLVEEDIAETDLSTGKVTLAVQVHNGAAVAVKSVSDDGHYVTYWSNNNTNPVPGFPTIEIGGEVFPNNLTELYVADMRPPTISIDPVASDNILDTGEQTVNQQNGLIVTGTTTDVEQGNTVTLTLEGTTASGSIVKTYTGTVDGNGNWSVTVTGADEAALSLGSQTFLASVKDNGATPAQTSDTFNVELRLAPSLTLNKVALDNVIASDEQSDLANTGLAVSGTTQNVNIGQHVTITFNGNTYQATVGANGDWSRTIPGDDVDAADLADGYYTLKASVDNGIGTIVHASELVRVGQPSYVFALDSNTDGAVLWSSPNGSSGSAALLKDPNPISGSTNDLGLNGLALLGNKLYFTASDGADGTALWSSDGTPAGTQMIDDIYTGPRPFDPFGPFTLVAAGDKLFFGVADATDQSGNFADDQIWSYDPATSSATKLTTTATSFLDPVAVGDKVYINLNDGVHGYELWVSDGTVANTHIVKDINVGSGSAMSPSPLKIVAVGDIVYFGAFNGTSNAVYETDGTDVGTTLVPDSGDSSQLTVVGNKVLFFDGDDASLHVTNGTSTQDLGQFSNGIYDITDVAGTAYFVSSAGALFATDANLTSQHLVKDFTAGGFGVVSNLTAVGDKLFFSADDGVHDDELWESDGTFAGTHLVKDINTNPNGQTTADAFNRFASSLGTPFTVFGNIIIFGAYDGANFTLWRSDGTDAGTFSLANVNAGFSGALPTAFVDADAVYFEGGDGGVWRSDGTDGGTYEVTPANAGTEFNGIFPIFPPRSSDIPPSLSGTTNAAFVQGGSAAVLSAAATVSDPDSANLSSATIRITGGTFSGDGDLLAATTTGTAITASYDSATETLALTGSDTLAHYQSVLDSITFSSSSASPTNFGADPTRTVTWKLNDGTSSSSTVTTTVTITALNHGPALTGLADAVYKPGDSAMTLSPGVTVADGNSADLVGATVSITGGKFAGDGDVLAATTTGTGITASYNSGTETLALSGSDTLAHYQQVLDSVIFNSTAANPTNYGAHQTRTVTFAVDDGAGSNNTASDSMTLSIKNPALDPSTTEIMVMGRADGNYLVLDLGNNTILSGYPLGQISTSFQVAALGDFSSVPGEADMLTRDGAGAFELYDINNNNITGTFSFGQVGPEWSIAGLGNFSGNAGETDMLMRQSVTGQFELFDIVNNQYTGFVSMGQVGPEWSLVGFGDFSGNPGENDMLMRQGTTGAFELFDITNNQYTGFFSMGQVGLEWSVVGLGDFSGNRGETDMLMRQSTTGAFELFDIADNNYVGFHSLGQVGPEWTISGFGNFSGNADESDMLMRQTATGAFEVFDITGNDYTGFHPAGQIGTEWSVAGIAADPPSSASLVQGVDPAQLSLLVQGIASLGGSGAVIGAPSAAAPADPTQHTLLTSSNA